MTSFLRFSLSICLLVAAPGAFAQDPFGGDDPFSASGSDPFATGGSDPFSGNSGNSAPSDTDSGFPGFGGGQTTAPAANATSNGQQIPEEETDPVVRLLRQSPPQSPSDMARGIIWMVRIKRWDEVGRLLDSLSSLSWSDPQIAELSREGGAALWVKLRSEDTGLTDVQKELVGEILRMPSKLAKNPKWVNQWVNQLASLEPGQRRMAQLRLQDAGVAGVEKLVGHLLRGDSPVPGSVLAQTLYSFGADGIDALHAASLVDDPASVLRLTSALASLPGKEFVTELVAGLMNRQVDEAGRQRLQQLLSEKYSKVPDWGAMLQHLNREFDNRLVAYFQSRATSAGASQFVWRWDSEKQAVVAEEASAELRELERLAQVAHFRRNADLDSLVEDAVANLQRRYQWDSALRAGTADKERLGLTSSESVMAVFTLASKWQMHGAAVRALQILPTQGDAATLNFLSDVLSDSRPVVRYFALEKIAKIDPQRNYRGTQQAVKTALEMSHLSSGPHALVVGLRSDLRQAAIEQLQRITTAEVSSANSAKSALLTLSKDEPIEFIVIADRVLDQTLFEFLQRLRNSSTSSGLPIAVLVENLKPHEEKLIAELGGVVRSVLSREPEQMRRVVGLLLQQLDTEPLNEIDRSEFAYAANNFLSKIAADRETYSFYSLSSVREQLVATVSRGAAGNRIPVLSGLGTEESQQELIELAATGDEAERLTAAKAFATSVKRFGNLLGGAAVKRAYELYNQYGPQDSSAVRILGHVLDVIEAQAGKREWPAPL